jgi:hypothetical protein
MAMWIVFPDKQSGPLRKAGASRKSGSSNGAERAGDPKKMRRRGRKRVEMGNGILVIWRGEMESNGGEGKGEEKGSGGPGHQGGSDQMKWVLGRRFKGPLKEKKNGWNIGTGWGGGQAGKTCLLFFLTLAFLFVNYLLNFTCSGIVGFHIVIENRWLLL